MNRQSNSWKIRKEIHSGQKNEFMDFVSFQLQRVSRREIAESTIKNYYRPSKLFCEMNGCAQMINWKMISRGL